MALSVRWLGMNAVYAEPERAILAALPVREQAFLHTLKAFMEGTLEEGRTPVSTDVKGLGPGQDSASESLPTIIPPGSGAADVSTGLSPILYTDHEDIPFGAGVQTPRKRPVYALCWTWRQSRVFKTKRECIEKQRVWKKWYERQGWKVSSHATGYFARHPSGQAHSISLHEYDRETNERLR